MDWDAGLRQKNISSPDPSLSHQLGCMLGHSCGHCASPGEAWGGEWLLPRWPYRSLTWWMQCHRRSKTMEASFKFTNEDGLPFLELHHTVFCSVSGKLSFSQMLFYVRWFGIKNAVVPSEWNLVLQNPTWHLMSRLGFYPGTQDKQVSAIRCCGCKHNMPTLLDVLRKCMDSFLCQLSQSKNGIVEARLLPSLSHTKYVS